MVLPSMKSHTIPVGTIKVGNSILFSLIDINILSKVCTYGQCCGAVPFFRGFGAVYFFHGPAPSYIAPHQF